MLDALHVLTGHKMEGGKKPLLNGRCWLQIQYFVSCDARDFAFVSVISRTSRMSGGWRETIRENHVCMMCRGGPEPRFLCSRRCEGRGKREGKVHWVVQSPSWISELFYNAVFGRTPSHLSPLHPSQRAAPVWIRRLPE